MKKRFSIFFFAAASLLALTSCEKTYVEQQAAVNASFTESFDSVELLYKRDWALVNNSRPIGALSWFQGNATVFPAYGSRASSNEYIAVNYNSTNTGLGVGNISNWLISPAVQIKNGDKISFYLRTVAANPRAERIQLRLNPADNSTDVGNNWNTVGKFTTLLLDVNPNYTTSATDFPQAWTRYEVTVSGLPAPLKRRFALRYFVENGGLAGNRSNFIGIDELTFTSL